MPKDNSSKTKKPLRRILIPVDGPIESKHALLWYVDNMKHDGDLLLFVRVIDPILPSALSALSVECESMPAGSSFYIPDSDMRSAKSLCQQLVQEASKYGIKSEAFVQVDTKPGAALVKFISEMEINVVVMPHRGFGFWRRNFMGSVSSYILHHSHVPVSVVPPMNHH
ncbi:unnamed protein product [Trichobilharzia regenti]|uniref:Usp domain-containing protein n=1 Tax=Trichobilharzia regenti TaxID=157069 RepID=A0A183VZ45_TRIRE|nr:unnamed protein product [Trichobilharzia regenti]CAH8858022.1 unnamed protein product [Trichobilharzia regenti]VDQ01630.1 unnamed protein product [Trichobilharzia regenti]